MYEISTALMSYGGVSSPSYVIAKGVTSYGGVTKSSVSDSMVLKKYGVALLRHRTKQTTN